MEEMKNHWKFYQLSAEATKTWKDSITNIANVEDYSDLMGALDIIKPTGLESCSDLFYFKNDIMPMWEDPSNLNGGRLILDVPANQKDLLHTIWSKTLAFCSLEANNGINGCSFAEKLNFRICIWVADQICAEEIGNAWKSILGIGFAEVYYSSHSKPATSRRFAQKGKGK